MKVIRAYALTVWIPHQSLWTGSWQCWSINRNNILFLKVATTACSPLSATNFLQFLAMNFCLVFSSLLFFPLAGNNLIWSICQIEDEITYQLRYLTHPPSSSLLRFIFISNYLDGHIIVYGCAHWMQVAAKARMGHKVSQSWPYRQLCAATWVLGSDLKSSSRDLSTLNHCTASQLRFLISLHKWDVPCKPYTIRYAFRWKDYLI